MITVQDLQIIILTYNRSSFLENALSSIYAQTVRGFDVLVLDNGSTDNTQEIVGDFLKSGVKFVRWESNRGSYANFLRAQEMADRKWVMLFHDDDIMHPQYVETALKTINSCENIVLVGCRAGMERCPMPVWKDLKGKRKVFENPADFAAFLFNGFPFAYCSAVYQTSIFKNTEVPNTIYGKWSDRPFLYNIASKGAVAVLTEPYIKYRLHPGQDIKNNSGSYQKELIALRKKYRDLLGENIFSKTGRVFVMNLYKGLRSEMRSKRSNPDWKGFENYVNNMITAGAFTKKSLNFGKLFYPIVFLRDNVRRMFGRFRRCI